MSYPINRLKGTLQSELGPSFRLLENWQGVRIIRLHVRLVRDDQMAVKRASVSRSPTDATPGRNKNTSSMGSRAKAGAILTKAKAKKAASTAKKFYADKASRPARTWKKGGRQWSRVLGHFGITD